MKPDDDIRGNSRRRQHRLQILQPALIQVRDAAADDVALESKRSDDGMDLPDRFGKILRAGRIAVVRDVWLVADLQRVLLQTGGSCRLHDAPRAGGEHVRFDPIRPVSGLHLAAGEHEERAHRPIREFGDERLDRCGFAVREEILAHGRDSDPLEERKLAGNRLAEPRVDAKNRHAVLAIES